MSKNITKAIAGLGIVAGLGVAIIPLASYADSVSGSITVNATVSAGEAWIASTLTCADLTVTGGAADCAGMGANTSATLLGGDVILTGMTVDDFKANYAALRYKANTIGTYAVTYIGTGTNPGSLTHGSATIPSSTTVAAGTAAWGFKLVQAPSGVSTITDLDNSTYSAVPTASTSLTGASALPIPNNAGDDFVFKVGVATGPATGAGTYSGGIQFTATSTAS